MTASTRTPGSRRLRLLFLLPHVPGLEGVTGGARSTAHLIAGLSKRHDVAALCLRRPHDPPTDAVLRQSCAVFEEIEVDGAASPGGRWTQRLGSKIGPGARSAPGNPGQPRRQSGYQGQRPWLVRTPGWVRRTAVPAYRQRVRSIAATWRPDVVHICYHVMGQYAAELRACPAPRVLTEYEPGVTAARDRAAAARGLGRVRARLELSSWVRYERWVLRQADAVVVLTERDRREVAPLAAGVSIVRIPLGTMIPARPADPLGAEPSSVLFVGNFIHPPNVDAALWLIRAIFPRVAQKRPDARLLIVGPGPTQAIRALEGPGVTITGAVDSVVPFLDAASVLVAPVRRGGGMRVKVMDALAAGKAVVATPLAAEGLDVSDGQQLMLADDACGMASAIVRLLDDSDERAALAGRARQWARAHLEWDATVAAYERLQEHLLETTKADAEGQRRSGRAFFPNPEKLPL